MNGKRVLVVADSEDTRRSLCLLLGLWGWTADQARFNSGAVADAVELRPDVVVLDIDPPYPNEFAGRIREALGTRARLVALSVHDDPDARRQALHRGFDTLVCKTADPRSFVGVLGRI